MKKPDLTFQGIPIYFDEYLPKDTFYLISTTLDDERQKALERILQSIRLTNRSI